MRSALGRGRAATPTRELVDWLRAVGRIEQIERPRAAAQHHLEELGRAELEVMELFPRFRALVESAAEGGTEFEVSYQSFI